jgi:RNA recognition motif-containing protein
MNRKLYVGNLPSSVTEDELQALFGEVGAVASINVMRDRETGRARGFAFVEMASEADAQNAIDKLHDRPFGGRTLTVNEARPQPARGFGGGGGAGSRQGGPRRRTEPRW